MHACHVHPEGKDSSCARQRGELLHLSCGGQASVEATNQVRPGTTTTTWLPLPCITLERTHTHTHTKLEKKKIINKDVTFPKHKIRKTI